MTWNFVVGEIGDPHTKLLLVSCHKLAAIVHTISFIVLVILLLTGPSSTWVVTIPSYNGARVNWIATYNLGWVLVSFPALSALNHLVYALTPKYQEYVFATRTNPVRWAEYAVSAGAMVWVIATLSGVTELRTLIALCVLNVALQYVGYLVEVAHAFHDYTLINSSGGGRVQSSDITRVGWFVFMAMWVEIVMSFFSVIEYDTKQKPPDIVYAIVIVLFVLFSTFGALQLAYIGGRLRNFALYEIGFIVLSFVSKTLLTWMVYGGVINAGTNIRQN